MRDFRWSRSARTRRIAARLLRSRPPGRSEPRLRPASWLGGLTDPALASTTAAAGIRRLLPHVGRIGGALLVITGAYVAYYGSYELRLYHANGDAADPIVDAAAGSKACCPTGWTPSAPQSPWSR